MAEAAQPLPGSVGRPSPSEFNATVGEDGKSLSISVEEATRLHLAPGTRVHLRLLPGEQDAEEFRQIFKDAAAAQKIGGVEITEEEAERLAVEASRDVNRRLTEQARRGD